jgi:hypothetical protein
MLSVLSGHKRYSHVTTVTLTGLHAHFGKARDVLMLVSALLKRWATRAAEQFHSTTVWNLSCDHMVERPKLTEWHWRITT